MGYRILFGIVISLAALSPQTIKSQATAKVALDGTKPIVYIQFVHAGPRQPIEEAEPAQGLWLRLVNNSIVPIEVRTDGSTPDGQMIVPDIVAPRMRPIPKSGPPPGRMPTGYFSPAYDVYQNLVISPGKNLIFSVPANHVAPSWDIQVPFQFSLPAVKQGAQPLCYAIFTWEDLPESYRTASASSTDNPSGAKRGAKSR